jgi:hypothetical protein
VTPGTQSSAEAKGLFRKANEDLHRFSASLLEEHELDPAEWPVPFLCECADSRCTRVARLTLDEFEQIRSHPGRFLVLPGHEAGDLERVIDATERFLIVEDDRPGRMSA